MLHIMKSRRIIVPLPVVTLMGLFLDWICLAYFCSANSRFITHRVAPES